MTHKKLLKHPKRKGGFNSHNKRMSSLGIPNGCTFLALKSGDVWRHTGPQETNEAVKRGVSVWHVHPSHQAGCGDIGEGAQVAEGLV